MEARLAGINTSIPGVVNKYDSSKNLATVKPTVKRRLVSGEYVALPEIVNVPVLFLQGGGASITFPIEKGDPVLIIFAQRSLDEWLSGDGTGDVEPSTSRKHDISDAIAIPGLLPSLKPAAGFSVQFKGASVTLTPTGRVKITSAPTGGVEFGNGVEELLSLLIQTLEALSKTQVATGIGPQPLTTAQQFSTIKTSVQKLKGV